MNIREIFSMVTLVWGIVKELLDFYKHLEEKYKWGRDKGPAVKQEVRQKKKDEFDEKVATLFEARSLPAPDRNTQEYIRELVHKKIEAKRPVLGKRPAG